MIHSVGYDNSNIGYLMSKYNKYNSLRLITFKKNTIIILLILYLKVRFFFLHKQGGDNEPGCNYH